MLKPLDVIIIRRLNHLLDEMEKSIAINPTLSEEMKDVMEQLLQSYFNPISDVEKFNLLEENDRLKNEIKFLKDFIKQTL